MGIFSLDNPVILSLAFLKSSFFPLKGYLAFDAADHLRDVFPLLNTIEQLKIKLINAALLVDLLEDTDYKLSQRNCGYFFGVELEKMLSIDFSMGIELFSGTLALFLFDRHSNRTDPLRHKLSDNLDLLHFVKPHQRV